MDMNETFENQKKQNVHHFPSVGRLSKTKNKHGINPVGVCKDIKEGAYFHDN